MVPSLDSLSTCTTDSTSGKSGLRCSMCSGRNFIDARVGSRMVMGSVMSPEDFSQTFLFWFRAFLLEDARVMRENQPIRALFEGVSIQFLAQFLRIKNHDIIQNHQTMRWAQLEKRDS